MRIIYLSPTGRLGGAEASLVEMVAAIRAAEPSWTLHVLMASHGPLASRAAALGATTSVLPFPRSLARIGESGAASRRGGYWRLAAHLGAAAAHVPGYVAELRRAIREFQPDIVHTNGLKMHLLGAWSSGGRPVVWHIHDYLGQRPLTARLLRVNAKRCAVVIANSRSVAEDFSAALFNHQRVVTLHNAVDLERFSPAGDCLDLDRLAGLPPAPPGTVRVGLLGTFARWKGHDILMRALARLSPAIPLRAYIVGDALYETDDSQYSRGELMAMARELGVADRVGFTGFVDRPESALRALDIVVHASTAREPFGLVIAEGMACGRAVVASQGGGAAEILTPGTDALSHEPGNAQQLADRLVELATDSDLRSRLGHAARAAAERRFTPARFASRLVDVYGTAAATPA